MSGRRWFYQFFEEMGSFIWFVLVFYVVVTLAVREVRKTLSSSEGIGSALVLGSAGYTGQSDPSQ